MIKPTIGRIVWYWLKPTDDPIIQPFAAQICFVHDDRMVNISYHDWNGVAGNATRILLYQGDTGRPLGPYCEWMPYQHARQAESDAG